MSEKLSVNVGNSFASLIWFAIWIAGVFLAKGFWSTFFSIVTFGIWSFCLVIEKILLTLGWISANPALILS